MRREVGAARRYARAAVVCCWLVPVAVQAAEPQRNAPRPPEQTAPAGGLALADLEHLALRHHPTLRQAAARVAAAQGRALQAGLYPNPTVGYYGAEIGAHGTAGEQGAFIDQQIVTGSKLRYRRDIYRREATHRNWHAVAQQYRVLNSVRMHYWRVLALDQLVAIRRELFRLAEETVVTTEELLNIGQVNRPDLLQAQAEARRARLALTAAEQQYHRAWRELAAVVGCPGLAPQPLDGDLEKPADEFDWEATLCHLLQASPEIQAARAGVVRSRARLVREQAEWIPDVRVRAGTAYNFAARDQHADVEVGMNIPLFDRNEGNIRAAQAEVARDQAEVARLELALRRRLADALAHYQTAQQTVADYRETILPQESEALQLNLAAFRERRADWPTVLMSQRSFFHSSIEYVEALLELRRLEVAISGLLLIDGLGASEPMERHARVSGNAW